MTTKPETYEKELAFISDALAESAAEMTDEEILAEVREEGLDPEVEAERIRSLLVDALDSAIPGVPEPRPRTREEVLIRHNATFFLTAEARYLIRAIAQEMGLTQTAAVEIMIREKALAMKIPLWMPGRTTQPPAQSPAPQSPVAA